MSYDRDGLLEQVKRKAIVHGRVTLASGKEADYYVDLRRITLDAAAAAIRAATSAALAPFMTTTLGTGTDRSSAVVPWLG